MDLEVRLFGYTFRSDSGTTLIAAIKVKLSFKMTFLLLRCNETNQPPKDE